MTAESTLRRKMDAKLLVLFVLSPSLLYSLTLLIPRYLYVRKFPRQTQSHHTCTSSFHISIPNITTGPNELCYVAPPQNYSSPYSTPLWSVPKSSLGTLNKSNPSYNLHINHQRWADETEDSFEMRHEGGTAGRAFPSNFDYARVLLALLNPVSRCNSHQRPPVMLDQGAGIGSVAAALQDSRGGEGKIQVLGYVLPDDYIRMQAIMSHRGLNSYLANFTGYLPFPDYSLDIVHCKWCWHWMAGYDVWLEEVKRVLVPGGTLVMSVAKKDGGGVMDMDEFNKNIDRLEFSCERSHKIVLICKLKGDNEEYCPDELRKASEADWTEVKRQVMEGKEVLDSTGMRTDQVLSVGCEDAGLCEGISQAFGDDVLYIADNAVAVGALLGQRRVAMLHEFGNGLLPMYPRSYDVVVVGCGKGIGGEMFWMDMHRVLRPGGSVILVGELCAGDMQGKMKIEMASARFKVEMEGRGVVIGSRMDV